MYYGRKSSDVVLKEGYFISDGKYVELYSFIIYIINNCTITIRISDLQLFHSYLLKSLTADAHIYYNILFILYKSRIIIVFFF